MHNLDLAKVNFKRLAAMFPSAVTETICATINTLTIKKL